METRILARKQTIYMNEYNQFDQRLIYLYTKNIVSLSSDIIDIFK